MAVTQTPPSAVLRAVRRRPGWGQRCTLLILGCLVSGGIILTMEGISILVLARREFQRVHRDVAARVINPYTGHPITVTGMKQSRAYRGRGLNDAELWHPYLGSVYAPFALGNIYYGNTNPLSPVGLYTDQYGFVHNGETSRDLGVKRPNTVRIMLLGGSTVEGADATPGNAFTIAAYLERLLNERFGRNGLDIQVVNAAHPGYSSVQNFLNASLYLIDEFQPDVLIDFEGRNDWQRSVQTTRYIKYYNGTEEMAAWGLAAHREAAPERSLARFVAAESLRRVSDSATAELLKKLAGRIGRGWEGGAEAALPVGQVKLVAGEQEKAAFNQSAGRRGYGAISWKDYFARYPYFSRTLTYRPEGLQAYLNNLQNLAGVCWQRDVACFLVLQPTLGGSDRPLSAQEREILAAIPNPNWLEALRPFYDGARQAFDTLAYQTKNDRAFFLDFAGIFDDVDGEVYHDSCHYYERGNRIIAEHLAEAVTHHLDLAALIQRRARDVRGASAQHP